MKCWAPVPLVFVLAACGVPGETPCNSDRDCGGETCWLGICQQRPEGLIPGVTPAAVCDLPPVFPAPGAEHVDVLAEVRAQVATEDPAGVGFVLQLDGVDVPARLLRDGPDVVLVPYAPLETQQSYTVLLTHECGQQAWTFTTQHLAASVDLLQRTYFLDLSKAVTTPRAVAGILGMTAPTVAAHVMADGAELAFLNAEGQQDACEPTVPLAGGADNPRYAWSVDDGPEGSPMRAVHGRAVSRANGSIDMALLATVDARLIAHHLLDTCAPGQAGFPECAGAVCAYFSSASLACEPCADGEPYCVVYAMNAPAIDVALTITARDRATICADANCSGEAICQ